MRAIEAQRAAKAIGATGSKIARTWRAVGDRPFYRQHVPITGRVLNEARAGVTVVSDKTDLKSAESNSNHQFK